MDIQTVLILLGLHYIADFLCQNQWMALNKSKSIPALVLHVLTYTLVLILGVMLINVPRFSPLLPFIWFGLLTFAFHFLTDFITSRVMVKLYLQKRDRAFFNTLGFDQFLHFVQIFVLYNAFIL